MKALDMNNYLDQVKAFIYGICLYLNIDKELAFIIVLLISADMFTGSLKVVFIEGKKFEFSEFWHGLIKKLLLLLLVMTVALIAKGLGYADFKFLVTIVLKLMVISEGISVFNNIRSAYSKKEFKSSDLISKAIESLTSYLTGIFDKFLVIFNPKK